MRDKNPVMIFPIMKWIGTEIYIDKRPVLYKPKGEPELSGKIEEAKMLAPRPTRGGIEKPSQQPVWNELN